MAGGNGVACGPTSTGRGPAVALAGWAALLVSARLWGLWELHHRRGNLVLGAIPLFGAWDLRLGRAAALAAVAGIGFAALAPVAAQRLSWRALVVTTALAAAAWAGALGGVDGARVLGQSIPSDYADHTGVVDAIGGPARFLDTYVERQGSYRVHLKAHPPGFVLFLWAAKRMGLRGPAWYIGLPLAATALAAAASVAAFAEAAGREIARRAAAFVALAPAAVWRVNPDAVFAAPVLLAIALVAAASARSGRRSMVLAFVGGVSFGLALLCSYGLVVLGIPLVAVAVRRRRLELVGLAGLGAAAVILAPALAGFSWLAGLQETRHQYAMSVAAVRPYRYFVVANLAVVALAIGPAGAVGLSRMRLDLRWTLVLAGAAAVVLADVSGLSKSEVERIWQPFFPLLLLAGASAAPTVRSIRPWLAAQATVAVVLQCSLRSPW